MTVTVLSREQWGAGPLKSGHLVDHAQFRGLVVHHTVMASHTPDLDDAIVYMRRLQKARPDLGPEVPYSWVVFRGETDADCIVAEGRGFGVTGAHTSGLNSTRYGVAYAGNASVDRITEGVLAGYRWVGQRIVGDAVATIGHRDTKPTECPGNNLYARLDEIQPPFDDPAEEPDDMTAAEHKMLADMNHIVAKVLVPGVAALTKGLAELRVEVDKLVADDDT